MGLLRKTDLDQINTNCNVNKLMKNEKYKIIMKHTTYKKKNPVIYMCQKNEHENGERGSQLHLANQIRFKSKFQFCQEGGLCC